MKLEQLLYFSEAVKYKSISIAAEKNFISQPTFSAAINKLERELGVTLLRRNSRGVKPTEVGEAILNNIYDIFTSVDAIRDTAFHYNHQGVVSITTIPCMCDRVLPIALKKMNEQQKAVTLAITCAESQAVYHQVLSGLAALGILFHSDKIASPEIRYTHLFEDEYVLYVGPASPYWNASSITIKEALAQPYIAYREEFLKDTGGLSALLRDTPPNIALRTDEMESIKKIISQDNYVAFFHRLMTKDDLYLQCGLIRSLPISDFDTSTRIGLIESTKYKPTAIDRLFIEALKSAVADSFK